MATSKFEKKEKRAIKPKREYPENKGGLKRAWNPKVLISFGEWKKDWK